MSTRIKMTRKIQQIADVKEADKYLSEYAVLSHEIDSEDDQLNKFIEQKKSELAEKQAPRKERMREIWEGLEQYAVNNKETHFSKKRSLELTAGSLSFRIHPAKVLQIKGFKVDKSIELLKNSPKGLRHFLVEKYTINKEQIIAEYGDLAKDEKLQADLIANIEECGLQLVKDETFGITLEKSKKQQAA